MRRKIGMAALAVTLLVLTAGLGWWWLTSRGSQVPAYRTAQVKQGDLLASISATGTIEPTIVVDVGAQVNGIIKSFGKDKNGQPVDYGSVVDQNTVLAQIDDSLYAAALETARAQLRAAEANRLSAAANVLQMKAKQLQAQQDWDRAQKLGPSDALSQSAYDGYRANFEVAKANLAAAEAAVEQANSSIAQNMASLKTAQINLGYCTIKAPVKGVIIDRQVNIGQTVVSSLSAASLFLLAKDLKRVMIWVSVNEADIGSIYAGQPVSFSVDAFPNRTFTGRVGKVRLNATMTQNVVTYTVEVNTNNDDGTLLPYLTANAKFVTGRRENVLLVPNAALRWSPRPEQIAPEARTAHQGARKGTRREARQEPGAADAAAPSRGTVWVEAGRFVKPVRVKTGLSDGAFTEVAGREVADGMRLVTGEAAREAAGAAGEARSPLMPQPMGRGQRQGQSGGEPPGAERPGQERPDSPGAERQR